MQLPAEGARERGRVQHRASTCHQLHAGHTAAAALTTSADVHSDALCLPAPSPCCLQAAIDHTSLPTPDFSEQQVLDCAAPHGCLGGRPGGWVPSRAERGWVVGGVGWGWCVCVCVGGGGGGGGSRLPRHAATASALTSPMPLPPPPPCRGCFRIHKVGQVQSVVEREVTFCSQSVLSA